MAHRAILVDVTRCVGCGACVEGCQQSNEQPAHDARGFDEQTYTYLMDRGNDVYVRRMCMHCEQPSCASVCPVGALEKTAAGPVTYDPAKCMGCRYCMMACPFGVPTYEWYSATPRVRKCEMCAAPRRQGPGVRRGLPRRGHGHRRARRADRRGTKRIGWPSPDHLPPEHLRPHGGAAAPACSTSARRSPAELGLPTSADAKGRCPTSPGGRSSTCPTWCIFGGVFLGGIYWLTKRKEEVARAEGDEQGGRP